MHRISSPDSIGINALASNARVYEVSPIGCFGVVRYTKSAIGSSSTHLPMADVSLFFR